MKGYKVFNPDWTCRGVQFEVGKTYEEEGKPIICKKGFHFCEKITDCFNYYSFDPENKVAEVEAVGEVDTNDDENIKRCTNKLHIVREITWQDVLKLVNLGKACTGFRNAGDWNTGNWNAGNSNTGNRNAGDCNTGNWNAGNSNTGNSNTGNWNAGNSNTGNWNSGDWNSGDWNSGDWNAGNSNTGNWNSGNWNSGDWNKTCFSNGCFNTEEPKIFIFNKLSDLTYRDWLNSKARYILNQIPSNCLSWVWEDDMTDNEKEDYPEYKVTGSFLKLIKKEKERQKWWDNLSEDDKKEVLALPNFDSTIFKEITGIDVEKESIC